TQGLIAAGTLDVTEARQLAAAGSLSGAIIGGILFGAGMVLARGCAARILVLSATGNLRALVTGLILTIVAQASLRGGLSPARDWLAGLWTVEGGASRDLISAIGLGTGAPLVIGAGLVLAALMLAMRHKVGHWTIAGALGVGLTIAAGWLLTYALASQSFNPAAIRSISFIGPSADTLMGFINTPTLPLVFDLGLIPGVFAGSFLAALFGREVKLQCFNLETNPMPRYVIGAVLMGFGGMLAGGCAVGAAVTGGAVFSLTAWAALLAMWAGAGLTDYLIDRRRNEASEAVATIPAGAAE
ncbi:MAG: YeeE/YedE family protein, partial [Rhodospirillales bacterium]|nr:YeeE/YedE family protein [Rhodospirillales bacterium]